MPLLLFVKELTLLEFVAIGRGETRATSKFAKIEHAPVIVEFHFKTAVEALFSDERADVTGRKLYASAIVGNHGDSLCITLIVTKAFITW